MATYTLKRWDLSSYTDETWTDIVDEAEPVALKLVKVAAGSNAGEIRVRIVDSSDNPLDVIIPSSNVEADTGYAVDGENFILNAGDKLQVWADASGMSFSAHGALADA